MGLLRTAGSCRFVAVLLRSGGLEVIYDAMLIDNPERLRVTSADAERISATTHLPVSFHLPPDVGRG